MNTETKYNLLNRVVKRYQAEKGSTYSLRS